MTFVLENCKKSDIKRSIEKHIFSKGFYKGILVSNVTKIDKSMKDYQRDKGVEFAKLDHIVQALILTGRLSEVVGSATKSEAVTPTYFFTFFYVRNIANDCLN